jgi:hypothetical protein
MRARLYTERVAGLRAPCAATRAVRPSAITHQATPAAVQVETSRRFISSHCLLDVVFLGGSVMVTGCASVKSSKVSEGTFTSWPWVNA